MTEGTGNREQRTENREEETAGRSGSAVPCNLFPIPSVKRPFWAWVFCEPDGTPSFSRVATAGVVAFVLGWVTHLVGHDHRLPDFGGVCLLIGTLYGINKVSGVFTR
jgi:hypothetical protein